MKELQKNDMSSLSQASLLQYLRISTQVCMFNVSATEHFFSLFFLKNIYILFHILSLVYSWVISDMSWKLHYQIRLEWKHCSQKSKYKESSYCNQEVCAFVPQDTQTILGILLRVDICTNRLQSLLITNILLFSITSSLFL